MVPVKVALLRKSVADQHSAFDGIGLGDTLRLRPSEGGETVEDGGADLHFGDLAIAASCHDALVIAAQSLPDCPAKPLT